jgi:hypothetical protein
MKRPLVRKAFFVVTAGCAVGAAGSILLAALASDPSSRLPLITGALASLSWSFAILAFWVSGEPMPVRSGESLGNDSHARWYHFNFGLLFILGGLAFVVFAAQLLAAPT